MAPGHKPLDPDTKRERRRLSSAVYEASGARLQNSACAAVVKTIANSDYHTKRKYRARAAEHSEQYRARKLQEERVERNCASIVKRCERKHEVDKLRASHMQAPAPKPQARPGVQQPRKTLPVVASSNPVLVSDGDDADEEESESDGSQASDAFCHSRALDNAVFPTRVHPVGTACKGCGLYDCPSCACILQEMRRDGMPGMCVRVQILYRLD
ncbi:hypothetical protein B0H14DRAFT_3508722 [Mycena olivaceomarginata]|nr:hypothetical protein B0H14DRAFT_3508722 [Mycena olivaceomarginata]